MFLERKPFHLKSKFFYQTKINLWEKDLNKFYINVRRKKKWSFLRPRFGKKRPQKLDFFRYQPLSFNPLKSRIKFNYKNNLYLRKLVRLKYGRLKNKEFYSLFKKSKDYQDLVINLGSRLDVLLFNFLSPISIFALRQHIVHGVVQVNGLKVKSPNIKLKPLDTISFNLIDFFNDKNFISPKDKGLHVISVVKKLYSFVSYKELSQENKEKLHRELAGYFYPKYIDKVSVFMDSCFKEVIESEKEKGNLSYSSEYLSRSGKKVESLRDFIQRIEGIAFLERLSYFLRFRKHYNFFSNRFKYFLSRGNERVEGLFNNEFLSDSIEIFSNDFYVDIVFLGFSSNKGVKNDNNQQKYLLHYLYQK